MSKKEISIFSLSMIIVTIGALVLVSNISYALPEEETTQGTAQSEGVVEIPGQTTTKEQDNTTTQGAEEVKGIAKELSLRNYLTENSKLDSGKFILQFPEMTPYYTEAEIKKLYKANFKWLLDDSLSNKPDLTKPYILEHTGNYVKLAITTYYRSNVNQYKEKLEDYLNDIEYRQRLNALFRDYLDEYWDKRN